jgi:hypothetical protein
MTLNGGMNQQLSKCYCTLRTVGQHFYTDTSLLAKCFSQVGRGTWSFVYAGEIPYDTHNIESLLGTKIMDSLCDTPPQSVASIVTSGQVVGFHSSVLGCDKYSV